MKHKMYAATGVVLLSLSCAANAASFIISNAAVGPAGPGTPIGDTLYAAEDSTPLSSGSVSIGYFPATTNVADIDTIPELFLALGSFTEITSESPGTPGFGAGYANQSIPTSTAPITGGNALIGRPIYSIVTDAASLAASTLSSGFALVNVGTIMDDSPDENFYSSNPAGLTPIIGTLGTFTGVTALGDGEYLTLNLALVPEPSTLLLSALGVLGLLRRKR